MLNKWSDADAKSYVERYAAQGVNEDLALRVYTTRLLGRDPKLVLHGGGNTSVKTEMTNLAGDKVMALCVKGSGWDMGDIEPAGLPAVQLAPLQRLAAIDSLSDEDMVNAQRCNLLDSQSPNPSVETLLHAFLSHKFVDHTHSNAVLALTDQPDDGADILRELYGDRVALVPYIMPGFGLAKKTKEVFDQNPDVEGMVMLKHGIFSFADDAKTAYDRMIEFVTMAEERLQKGRRNVFAVAPGLPKKVAKPADVAPVLRGLNALPGKRNGDWTRWVFEFRSNDAILNYVNAADVERMANTGTVTPDHSIRTKPLPLIVPAPDADDMDGFRSGAAAAMQKFRDDYHAYFERQNAAQDTPRKELDPAPRVILVPGLGLYGIGKTAKDAKIAADLAETAIEVITNAEAIGRFESISEPDMFEIEYWSLEQAKLGKGSEKALARQVAVVTGGGSGIGAATAKALRAEGAEVAVLDLKIDDAMKVATAIGGLAVECDVTDKASVTAAFQAVAETFGGVDILVSNAGAAWQGKIGEVDDETLRKSFELNFFGHQNVAQAAVRIMRAQGTGGCLLFNTSKQAVNPGKDFGPYGLPKAATLFLSRQYALDHGADGIRSNAVNADRIRSGLLTDDMIASRSKARGLSEGGYMGGNLLKREVTADDVANAFVALATATSTTGAVITVDGGNIEAALR
jgi:rhamnulose-1-phosphate aldolase/alcohol dehydrogenase